MKKEYYQVFIGNQKRNYYGSLDEVKEFASSLMRIEDGVFKSPVIIYDDMGSAITRSEFISIPSKKPPKRNVLHFSKKARGYYARWTDESLIVRLKKRWERFENWFFCLDDIEEPSGEGGGR